SLAYGITRFDSSVGGLGGCPYAPGAAGNVATNDVLYLLHGLGIETGINEDKMREAAFYIQNKLGKSLPSKSLAAVAAQECGDSPSTEAPEAAKSCYSLFSEC